MTRVASRAVAAPPSRRRRRPVLRWGFVGLGEMGLPMALCLARAGIPLTVLHRHSEGRTAAARLGAVVAAGIADLSARADVVGICVRDEAQVGGFLLGEDGFLSHSRRGTLLVIHSTISPGACVRLAAEASRHGVRLIDAPVTGMPIRAQTGDLTIYVGGRPADLEVARPGLEAMGSKVLHMGGVGAGQVTKLANNLVANTTIAAIAEALALGAASGIEPATLMTAFQAGSANSFILQQFPTFQAEWRPDDDGSLASVAAKVGKDLGLAAELGREHLIDLPLAGLARALLPQSVVRTVAGTLPAKAP